MGFKWAECLVSNRSSMMVWCGLGLICWRVGADWVFRERSMDWCGTELASSSGGLVWVRCGFVPILTLREDAVQQAELPALFCLFILGIGFTPQGIYLTFIQSELPVPNLGVSTPAVGVAGLIYSKHPVE